MLANFRRLEGELENDKRLNVRILYVFGSMYFVFLYELTPVFWSKLVPFMLQVQMRP